MKKLSVFIVPLLILGIIVLFGCQKTQAPTEAPLDVSALEKSEPQSLAKGKDGQSGKSETGHLYFYEKDPSTWIIVDGGAWGKMKYNLSGPTFDFVFNGHGLVPTTDYTLIYYPDPWPGSGLKVLGIGIVNDEGDIHISGSIDPGEDLPADWDDNSDESPTGTEIYGAKIWLILTADYGGDPLQMTGWNPADYLFENAGTFFEDTDAP